MPTLYQKIAAELMRKISSGEVSVGSALPTERQLMMDFGASRNTIRAALAQLETSALITRRRNRGSTVVSQSGAPGFVQSLSTLEDLVSFAKSANRQVKSAATMVMDRACAKELSCQPGSRWLHIAMTRIEDNATTPLTWTDAFIDPTYADLGKLAKKHPDRLLSDLIEWKYGRRIATVEQSISSCFITGELLAGLMLDAPTHGLKIIRRYRDGSKAAVLVTRSVYPGERYTITSTLVRG